jgi:hypothetical protein
MSTKDNIDRVWDIVEKVGACMLTTLSDGHEIEVPHDVGLVCIDSSDKAYLSITGRAGVSAMPFGGRPMRCGGQARIVPTCACCGSSRSRRNYGMDRHRHYHLRICEAKVTGKEPNLGENRNVTVKM